jgi:hypothetical protein
MKNGNTPINPVHFKTDDSGFEFMSHGLTKREYFAAMAMQGIITVGHGTSCQDVAQMAVEQADALLKALEE